MFITCTISEFLKTCESYEFDANALKDFIDKISHVKQHISTPHKESAVLTGSTIPLILISSKRYNTYTYGDIDIFCSDNTYKTYRPIKLSELEPVLTASSKFNKAIYKDKDNDTININTGLKYDSAQELLLTFDYSIIMIAIHIFEDKVVYWHSALDDIKARQLIMPSKTMIFDAMILKHFALKSFKRLSKYSNRGFSLSKEDYNYLADIITDNSIDIPPDSEPHDYIFKVSGKDILTVLTGINL